MYFYLASKVVIHYRYFVTYMTIEFRTPLDNLKETLVDIIIRVKVTKQCKSTPQRVISTINMQTKESNKSMEDDIFDFFGADLREKFKSDQREGKSIVSILEDFFESKECVNFNHEQGKLMLFFDIFKSRRSKKKSKLLPLRAFSLPSRKNIDEEACFQPNRAASTEAAFSSTQPNKF